ncbi:unnamed protein product, partial [Amoebophrya sp. A25]
QNLWLVKPVDTCRGTGIRVLRDFRQMLTAINRILQNPFVKKNLLASDIGNWRYLAQKYLEHPLLIAHEGFSTSNYSSCYASPFTRKAQSTGRLDEPQRMENYKFDIRQWVLVTGWNEPHLRVWYYEDCYLRVASKAGRQHVTKEADADQFMHLTNNAVVKNTNDIKDFDVDKTISYNHDANVSSANASEAPPLTWRSIKWQMKRLVWISLRAAAKRRLIRDRKNSFEIFGYDFMVDEKGKVWLIEVNSNPDLSYSTSTTRDLVPLMLADA